MTTRREICTYAAFLVAGTCVGGGSRIAFSKDGSIASLADDIGRLEAESGGRLGVAVLDTRTGAAPVTAPTSASRCAEVQWPAERA